MGQVLSNLARILFGRKKEALKNVEERKQIHPNSGYEKTRVSEEDEGSVVIVITDADQVKEDVAQSFPLVSGDQGTRLSEDEGLITIIIENGVEAVEKINPVTDAEVSVDAEPFPLLSIDPKNRVSENERIREDVEPFLVSVDPKPRVSEDKRVTITVDSGVEVVEKTKHILHVSGDKIRVPKDVSGSKAKKGEALQKERRIKHYCSSHKILLVGEGDFSFSACLANVFGSADNMVATSLNSEGFLKKNYGKAMFNISDLKNGGCMVLHGVDATNMSGHEFLKSMRFDRIVFNFPHAGFSNKESRETQISRHQKLITLFFKNAKKMLHEEGEIHISHKSVGFHLKWNIESLASLNGLTFIKAVRFNLSNYPGYNTKYGFGGDGNFDCNPSKTYMFGL